MKQIFRISIVVLLLAHWQHASSFFRPEKYFFKNVHLKNGLSQCVVTSIVQDKMGFIWASTFDGLNRFDGNSIKVFRHDLQDPNSILSSKIFMVVPDDNNHLFLTTSDGFCIFDCKSEKIIKPEVLAEGPPAWVGNRDANHMWYYAEKKGLLLLDTRDFTYQLMANSLVPNPDKNRLSNIIEYHGKLYYIFSDAGVIIYDLKTNQQTYFPNVLQLNSEYLYSEIDKYGKIYIAINHDDLIYFDTKSKKFGKSDFYKKNQKLIAVTRLKYDSLNDVLFLGTYGQGMFTYEYQTGNLTQFKKGDAQFPISSNYISSLCINQLGMIYIAYDGMGFDVIDPYIKKFSPITYESVVDQSSLKYVRKMVEDDFGNILVGTSESGLVKYNREKHQFNFYNFRSSHANTKEFIIDMIRNGDELWLGYNSLGICVVDIHTLKLKRNIYEGKSDRALSGGTIWSLCKDNQNNMWAGTRDNGLNKINLATGIITKYEAPQFPALEKNGIRCLYNFNNNEILLGTEMGLFIFYVREEKLQKVFPLNASEAAFKGIKSIFKDYKNRHWLATDGGGIVVLEKNYQFVKNFSTIHGLGNNVIYGILPQNDTSFWISSNAGICNIIWNENVLYKNEALKTHNYDELNGLQSNEFNSAAFAMLQDGSMVFGGLNGINIFKPEQIRNNPVSAEVYLSEFKIFENPLKSAINISYLDKVDLKHFENSISIVFNTLGFSIPEKTFYKYRLLGYDDNWIDAKNRNYVSFTNLSPGDYEFQVKATNYDGVWSNSATKLKICIATPFYNTWWFYLLLTVLLLTLFFLGNKYRSKELKEKEAIKLQFAKELSEVEMKALRAQINPHFLFNSLNSINNYILKNDTKLASKYLVQFSQLIRNILNNSSSPYISLQEELKTIELYMMIEGMRFSNQFSYQIIVDPQLNTAVHSIPSLLLQPYVENAIWHGLLHKEGEKNIIISVSLLNSDAILISIEDNGTGRKISEEHGKKTDARKSFGMQLGESRIRLLNKGNTQIAKVDVIDLHNEQGDPIGTKIDIIIPAKLNITDFTPLNE